jgi:hypothetical protein
MGKTKVNTLLGNVSADERMLEELDLEEIYFNR